MSVTEAALLATGYKDQELANARHFVRGCTVVAKGPGGTTRHLTITLLYTVIIFYSKAFGHYAVIYPVARNNVCPYKITLTIMLPLALNQLS